MGPAAALLPAPYCPRNCAGHSLRHLLALADPGLDRKRVREAITTPCRRPATSAGGQGSRATRGVGEAGAAAGGGAGSDASPVVKGEPVA